MDSRKEVMREVLYILIGEVVGVALMFGVYFLLHRFTVKVLAGGLVGLVLTTLNFFFMALSASIAADKATQQDVKAGSTLMRSSYLLRLIGLFALLFAAYKSGYCELFSLLIPLLFVRPTIFILEFFRKPGENNK